MFLLIVLNEIRYWMLTTINYTKEEIELYITFV